MEKLIFKSILLISAISLSLVFLICSLGGVSNLQENNPEDLLFDFFRALQVKDKSKLIPFLVNEPTYVSEKAYKEFKEIYKISNRENKITKDTPANKNVKMIKDTGEPIKLSGIELVNSIVSIDTFLYQNRYIKEVVKAKVNGNEARIRLKLASKGDNDGRELADVEYDFFLFREKLEWKIFMIKPIQRDNRFDTYRFYAEY